MTTTPKIILRLCLVISLICLVSALAGLAVSAMQKPPLWFLLMFEVAVLVASFFGVLTGLGKIREGPALTMLILGGTLAVGAMLGEPALPLRLAGRSGSPITVNGIQILPFALARLGAGFVMTALAAVTILVRRPRQSFGYLIRGILFGLPVLGAFAAAVIPPIRGAILGLPTLAGFFIAVFGFFIIGGFLCASLHFLIRAFEAGQVDRLAEAGATALKPVS